MKKIIVAAAGALWIAAAMGMPAAAEETESAMTATTEGRPLEWNDAMLQAFEEEGYSGQIFTVDALGLQLLIPEGLEQRQPTEEEKAKDDILVFESEDQTKKVEFVLGPVSDCKTLDEVKTFMEEAVPGLTVTPTKINEYDTLVYGNGQADSMAVLIGAGDAGFLRIICRPISDPDMYRQYSFLAASIKRLAEAETESE